VSNLNKATALVADDATIAAYKAAGTKVETLAKVTEVLEASYAGGSTRALDAQQKKSALTLATYMLDNGDKRTFTTVRKDDKVVITSAVKTATPTPTNGVTKMASTNFIYSSPAPVAAPFRTVASTTAPATAPITSITLVIYNKEVVSAVADPVTTGIDFVDPEYALVQYVKDLQGSYDASTVTGLFAAFKTMKGTDVNQAAILTELNASTSIPKVPAAGKTALNKAISYTQSANKDSITFTIKAFDQTKTITVTGMNKMSTQQQDKVKDFINKLVPTAFDGLATGKPLSKTIDETAVRNVLTTAAGSIQDQVVKASVIASTISLTHNDDSLSISLTNKDIINQPKTFIVNGFASASAAATNALNAKKQTAKTAITTYVASGMTVTKVQPTISGTPQDTEATAISDANTAIGNANDSAAITSALNNGKAAILAARKADNAHNAPAAVAKPVISVKSSASGFTGSHTAYAYTFQIGTPEAKTKVQLTSSFESSIGTISSVKVSGSLTSAGTYILTITSPNADAVTLTVTVTAAPVVAKPVISLKTGNEGLGITETNGAYSYAFTLGDANRVKTEAQLIAAFKSSTGIAVTGSLSGVLTTTGTHTLTLSVNGGTDVILTITVSAAFVPH
ncbi:MAG: hypothetical protein KAH32_00420, partial [Chlamydiia bacterium]|nr:hypothetical protein [Chlamydiia bacterium]